MQSKVLFFENKMQSIFFFQIDPQVVSRSLFLSLDFHSFISVSPKSHVHAWAYSQAPLLVVDNHAHKGR